MEQSRREFIARSLASATGLTYGAALASIAGTSLPAEAAAPLPPPDHASDEAMLRFWTQHVRDPRRYAFAIDSARPGSRGPKDPSFDYTPTFYAGSDTGSLTPIHQVTAKELVTTPDVLMHYKLVTYKPSLADAQKKLQTGSLRVDVSQAAPIPQFSQPFSWSTVLTLALTDNGNSLPAIMRKIVNPRSFWDSNSIVLPNGEGYLAKNLFVQEKPHHNFWSELMGAFKSGVEVLGIVTNIGLPLVSQPALNWIDGLYGTVATANAGVTHHIFQSSDMPIAATQAALNAALMSDPHTPPLAIKTGDYVSVPQWQSPQFEAEVIKGNYTLIDGYLVPKGTTTTNEQELQTLATKDPIMQQYTYIVVSFHIEPYTMPVLPPEVGPLLGGGVHSGGSPVAPGGHPATGGHPGGGGR